MSDQTKQPTQWERYEGCRRLTCPAKAGEPCRDGYYGRTLKNPHRNRPRVAAEGGSEHEE